MPPGPARSAPTVRGVHPDGSPATVAVARSVAVLFLTSSCKPCQVYWAPIDAAVPVLMVTPDAATEDRRRVVKLAARCPQPVVMSSEAWLAFGVTKAPWLVVVAGGVVVADQEAPALVDDALALIERVVA